MLVCFSISFFEYFALYMFRVLQSFKLILITFQLQKVLKIYKHMKNFPLNWGMDIEYFQEYVCGDQMFISCSYLEIYDFRML